MTIQELRTSTEQKMTKSLDTLKAGLSKVRTGRAHPGLLEHITVDYYGSPTPLSQVANLSLVDARTIGVSPYEKKMVAVVEKAIRESDLGLNPANSGDLIRVPMPPTRTPSSRVITSRWSAAREITDAGTGTTQRGSMTVAPMPC